MFALSLALLVANAALFATRQNWKKKAETAQGQIAKIEQEKTAQQEESDAKLKEADQKLNEAKGLNTQLKGDLERANDQIKQKEVQVEQLGVRNQSLTQSVDKYARNIEQLGKENKLQQDKIRELQANLDSERKERKEAVSEAAELESQLETSRAKVAQLQTETKTLKDELEKWKKPTVFGPVVEKALDGFVKSIQKGYVVVSVGSKDGVKEGDTFDVYRGKDKYVGRLKVVQIAETFALTKEIGDYQQVPVREGDLIANYLGASVP